MLVLDNGIASLMAFNISPFSVMLPAGYQVVAYAEPSDATEIYDFDHSMYSPLCSSIKNHLQDDEFLLATIDSHLDSFQKDSIVSVL